MMLAFLIDFGKDRGILKPLLVYNKRHGAPIVKESVMHTGAPFRVDSRREDSNFHENASWLFGRGGR
jgi:hypothetical protein